MASIQLNLWAVFFSCVAIQGCFLSGILFSHKKGYQNANKCLALLVLIFTIILTEYIISISGLYERWPHLMSLSGTLWYLMPPLFYFYIKLMLSESLNLRWKSIVHLIPFAIFLQCIIPFYLAPAEMKLAVLHLSTTSAPSTAKDLFYMLIFPVQMIVYLFAGIKLLWRYEKHYKNQFANRQKKHLRWLKMLLILLFTHFVFDLTIILYRFNLKSEIKQQMEHAPMIVLATLIYSIAYLAIRHQSHLFPSYSEVRKKYQNSILSSSTTQKHLENLSSFMENEKPYLKDVLTLSEVAMRLHITPRHLSEILNQKLGVNFSDFINSYRVEEVKRRLKDPAYQNYTLLSIALETGFSSKASFNRIFKKHTGVTPSQYFKSHRIYQAA